jgi:hypothetical protein
MVGLEEAHIHIHTCVMNKLTMHVHACADHACADDACAGMC